MLSSIFTCDNVGMLMNNYNLPFFHVPTYVGMLTCLLPEVPRGAALLDAATTLADDPSDTLPRVDNSNNNNNNSIINSGSVSREGKFAVRDLSPRAVYNPLVSGTGSDLDKL